MSVWGGLIARDVTEMATDGDAEDVAELAEVIGPMLDRYGLAMPNTDATLLEAARRYWVPCPVSCRGAVVDLVDTCGVSVGGSGLVIVDDGALAVVGWADVAVAGAYLGPGVTARPEIIR